MSVVSYKCPNCDGELVFDPITQKYKCEYCISIFSQEEIVDMEPEAAKSTLHSVADSQELVNEPREDEVELGGVAYHCPSCGAQIVTEKTTAATYCYYCHNPVVLSGRVSGEFLPERIIPFAIDKKQAETKFLEFVHSKKFVPRAFFNKHQIEKISGVYFPYWMVDLDMEGNLSAIGKNTRTWWDEDTEYHETKVYHVERNAEIHFKDITKNALKSVNAKVAQGVLPYDISKAKTFHMSYLSGFLAERRDIERSDLQAEVSEEARNYGERMIRNTIGGYSTLSVQTCSVHSNVENWEYILLPVWTLTYKGRDGKMYYYSMNGQNGKVYGELPIDHKKMWMLGGFIFLLVFLLGLAGGYIL